MIRYNYTHITFISFLLFLALRLIHIYSYLATLVINQLATTYFRNIIKILLLAYLVLLKIIACFLCHDIKYLYFVGAVIFYQIPLFHYFLFQLGYIICHL